MHLRALIGCLCFISAFGVTPLHAQTDHPISTTPVTRAIAVYEWTGDLAHPTAARLLPVSLFINAHLEDAGIYLAQPIPFALQTGTLYLLQHAGQTIGALNIQSAHSLPSTSAPTWAAYGRYLTPTETATATTAPIVSTSNPGAPGPDSRTPAATTVLSEADTDPTPPTPTARKTKPTKQQAYVTAPTTPILDDPDRPILQSSATTAPATPPELTTLPPDLHQATAVSDAANRAPETFAYTWPSHTTQSQTLQALEALALPPHTHYIAFNHLTPVATKPGAPRPDSRTRAQTKPPLPPPITLENAQLLAYTLTDTTTPTYILTTELPLTTAGPLYLTLIAQPDPNTHLRLTLLSLTDAAHLDRTPRLIPIDAVDPDATGRAQLLVELRSQTTRQFALYALTATHPQQTLLTTPIESPPPQN